MQRVQAGGAFELGAGGHHVDAVGAQGATARLAMLQGVIREAARGDLAELAPAFRPDNHPGGDDGGVLDEFLVILGADAFDDARDAGAETGDDFFL